MGFLNNLFDNIFGTGLDIPSIMTAATNGDVEKQYLLGIIYEEGKSGVKKNYKQAMEWYQKAAQNGYTQAMNKLAFNYRYGKCGVWKNAKKAVEWDERSARCGDSEGQMNFGMDYIWGVGVQKDFYEGIKWINLSAEQGNQSAINYKREHGL